MLKLISVSMKFDDNQAATSLGLSNKETKSEFTNPKLGKRN